MMRVVVIHKDWSESTIYVSESQKDETIELVKGWFQNGWITAWDLRK